MIPACVTLVAPEPPTQPTGGHRYNEEVLRRLGGRIAVARYSRTDSATISRIASGRPRGPVAVDSLFFSRLPFLRGLRNTGQERLVGLAHMPAVAVGSHVPAGARPTRRIQEAEGMALRLFDTFVAPSAYVSHCLGLAGVPDTAVHICPPGVDSFDPVGQGDVDDADSAGSGTGLRLLSVCNVTLIKNLHIIPPILSRLDGEGIEWTWTIVGSTSVDAQATRLLRAALRKTRTASRTDLVGPLPHGDARALMARRDMLLHPSLSETYGMVVAEALALGTPVLAHRVGALGELLPVDALVEPGDAAGWFDRLVGFRNAGRPRVLPRRFPDWDGTADCFWEALCADAGR